MACLDQNNLLREEGRSPPGALGVGGGAGPPPQAARKAEPRMLLLSCRSGIPTWSPALSLPAWYPHFCLLVSLGKLSSPTQAKVVLRTKLSQA